jgi:hypothetical protein
MTRIRAFLTVRFLVAALIVLLGAALYMASLPKSDAGMLVCTYYSDATYKTAVGGRGTGCCGANLNWGVVTAYKKCQAIYCTDQICPN